MKTYLPFILIVDDEESIRRNLQEYLIDEGYEVLTAGSGEEGLIILQNHTPDLSVVDIRLPGMDGNAFIHESHRLFPQMKFLVFTGSMEYTLPEELRTSGLAEHDILRKPLKDLSLLTSRIRHLCERTNAHG